MTRVVLNFKAMNDGKLEALAGAVLASMTGNANFPNPPIGLDKLGAAITTFSASMVQAESKDKIKMAQKKEARQALQDILSATKEYINYVANTVENGTISRSLILSSGFDANSETKAGSALGSIENFTVEIGKNSGDVMLSVSAVDNCKGYLFFWCEAPQVNDAWVHVPSSVSSYTFTGLPVGKLVMFKAGAIGTRGQAVYSTVISRIVS